MSARPTLIFDFDSTLVGFETLEALADIALAGSPEADQVRAQIADLTDKAMSGEIAFGEALRRRLALLPLTRAHIATLAETAPDHLTASVRRNLVRSNMRMPIGQQPEPPSTIPAITLSGSNVTRFGGLSSSSGRR